MPREEGRLAVTLHDIEPSTFEHCSLIREWLDDLGVERATLCVIPAADHHPFYRRSPGLAEWLHERRQLGDAIAQQGLVAGRSPSAAEAPAHVRSGRRLPADAGLEPSGYRAPGLAHVMGAWKELATTVDWWIAAGVLRTGSLRRGGTLRIDVRPRDFDGHPGRTRALERTLRRAVAHRDAVTLDEVAWDEPRLRAEAPRVARVP